MIRCKECGDILIIVKRITPKTSMYKCRTCGRIVYLDYDDLKKKKSF